MKNVLIAIIILVGLLLASQMYSIRWDATTNERFSFSESTINTINSVEEPLRIDVYLNGDLTGNFRLLKNETQYFLEELQDQNKNISYRFVSALGDGNNIDSLASIGVQNVSVPTEDKILRVFPFATLNYKNKVKTVPLLVNTKIPIDQRATASIDNIEKSFIDKVKQLTISNKKNVGILVHHNELPPMYLDGFLKQAAKYYNIIPITEPVLDSSYSFNESSLHNLEKMDAIVIAKPIKSFTDNDKLILDQYVMNNGKTLWFTESVDAEMDSLFRSNRIVAFPRDLNLNDLFFSYGIRIVPSIVKDRQSGFITLAIGEMGNNTAYEQFPWPYFPVSIPNRKHPITANVGNPVKFEFANPIELLDRENITTTVLLHSSPNWQLQEPLSFVNFSEIEQVNEENYPARNEVLPLAVLLEGKFKSAYDGRLESKTFKNFKSESNPNKMIIVSDGDVIKNHVFRGEVLPLGADKYTMRPDVPGKANAIYGNSEFVINALNYLVEDNSENEISDVSKQIFLMDDNKIAQEKNFWRWLNLLLPLGIIWIMGFILLYLRKKRYA